MLLYYCLCCLHMDSGRWFSWDPPSFLPRSKFFLISPDLWQIFTPFFSFLYHTACISPMTLVYCCLLTLLLLFLFPRPYRGFGGWHLLGLHESGAAAGGHLVSVVTVLGLHKSNRMIWGVTQVFRGGPACPPLLRRGLLETMTLQVGQGGQSSWHWTSPQPDLPPSSW